MPLKLFLNLSASPLPFFFIVALHPQVQTLAQLVEKIGTALALAPFDVGISVIETSRIETNTEQLAEESGQFVHGYLSVVNTFHLVQGVYQLDYFDYSSRPTSFTNMRFRRISISVAIQYLQLRVDISDDDMQETNLSTTLRRFLFRDIAA